MELWRERNKTSALPSITFYVGREVKEFPQIYDK